MHLTELQSFISKFHHLWEAGYTAHLNLDTHAGQAWVGLRVQLGQVPGPGHQQPHQPPSFHRRSPSYHRRQERRRTAKAASAADHIPTAAAEENLSLVKGVNSDTTADQNSAKKAKNNIENSHEKVNNPTEEVDKTMEEKTAEKVENDIENSTEQVEGYFCDFCDFKSNWRNGLSIHLSRKHWRIEQLDGNDDGDTDEDREYDETIKYWKEGKISTVYQSFLDVNAIIEKSDLAEHEKKVEKEKVMEARKVAFGDDLYRYYPPWRAR